MAYQSIWYYTDLPEKVVDLIEEDLAEKFKKEGNHVVADFICPTPEARKLFNPDYIVWVDTIKKGRFEDTNQMFVKPKNYDFHENFHHYHFNHLSSSLFCLLEFPLTWNKIIFLS